MKANLIARVIGAIQPTIQPQIQPARLWILKYIHHLKPVQMVLNDAKLMITFITRHNATRRSSSTVTFVMISSQILCKEGTRKTESEQDKPLFRSESIPFHCNAMSVDETDLRRL